MRASRFLQASVATLALCMPSVGMTQVTSNDQGAGIQEIVVTAQRRSESSQKVPIAITALTGDSMQERGISNIEAIHYQVPNLTLGTQQGVPRIVLRGIGIEGNSLADESKVAAHLNNVYLGRPWGLLSSFYDIERVEVLRGPQGTLYGRNATGGAINVTTRRPTDKLDGYLLAGYGNYNDVKLEGAVGGPLDDQGQILQRVAFTFNRHDGYGKNETTGKDIDNLKTWGARSTTVLNPDEDLSIAFIVDYDHQNDRSGQYHFLAEGANTDEPGATGIRAATIARGGVFPSRKRNINGDFPGGPRYRRETWGGLVDLNWALGAVDLRSVSAYRKSKSEINMDISGGDALTAFWNQSERAEQFSQDIQLSSSSERFKWVLGAYFFDETYNGRQSIPINGLVFGAGDVLYNAYFAGGSMKTRSLAGYGQATFNLTDKLSITGGARYSWERKKIVSKFEFNLTDPYRTLEGIDPLITPGNKSWKSFTPKIGVEYQIDPSTMLYASATKGFKSGTFLFGPPQGPVKPETLWAYEAGIKTTQFDRRLQLNLTGFYYDYSDLQVTIIAPGGLSNTLENAAAMESYGAEAELIAKPVDALELGASVAWLHARFKQYQTGEDVHPGQTSPGLPAGQQDLSGFTPAQSPDYSVNLSAQYTIDTSWGNLALRGESFFVDRIYYNQFDRKILSQKAHSRHNIYLTARTTDDAWRVTAYIRNLTNALNLANATQNSSAVGFTITGTYEAPRTYGVEISRKF